MKKFIEFPMLPAVVLALLPSLPHSGGKINGTIIALGNMQAARFAHTSTLLPDGRVFIAGGQASGALASTEVYDPTTRRFSVAATMRLGRSGHSATLLPNGTILIAGGYNGDYISSAEIYDPNTDSFIRTDPMKSARSGHEAILLKNGKVLLAGGVGKGWTFLASAEIYDPETRSFTPTGSMSTARESHTATLLGNGKVLITGGHKGRRAGVTIYSSTEIFDPVTGAFSPAGEMTVRRHKHDAVLLSDGRVLIAGGSDEEDRKGAYVTTEIYDPQTGKFTVAATMNSRRYKLRGTTILLGDRKVLIAGGSSTAELFDPETNSFGKIGGSFGTDRFFSAVTLLRTGQVLITGGYDEQMTTSSVAWLYERYW